MFGRDKSNNNASDDVTVPMQDVMAPPMTASDPNQPMTLPAPQPVQDMPVESNPESVPISVNTVENDPVTDNDTPQTMEESAPEVQTTPEIAQAYTPGEGMPEMEAHEEEPEETPQSPVEAESLAETDTNMETEKPMDEQPSTNASSNTDLNTIKQNALRELSGLIGHLDQTPEEKYATAKMIYDETKDQNSLNAVFEAAKNLPDEKARANALHDVVSTINQLG